MSRLVPRSGRQPADTQTPAPTPRPTAVTEHAGHPVPPVPTGRVPTFLHTRIGGLPPPFWVLWWGTLINRFGTMVHPFLGLYLAKERGLSLAAVGAVLGLLGAGSIVSQLAGGRLADTIGRRPTLTLAMIAYGAALLALGYAHGLAAIMATALLLGLVMDMYRPASLALVADLVPPDGRSRAFGLLFWAVNLGFAVAMVAGGALARAGYLWLFWVDAVTGLVFGLMVWRAVPEPRSAPAERSDGRRTGFKDVLRDRVMVGYTLVFLAYTAVLMQGFSTLPLAMRADGLSPQAYGIALAGNGLLIITLQPMVNTRLADHDNSLVIAYGLLVFAVGMALNTVASTVWTYACVVPVWTIGEVMIAAVGPAVVADLAPERLRGRYSALWGVAWSSGFLLAPLFGTRLLATGAATLWLTCAVICVLAAAGQLALAPAIRRRAR